MNGFIDVQSSGREAHYEARCACGWCGGEAASVDWADLALAGHFEKAHTEDAA